VRTIEAYTTGRFPAYQTKFFNAGVAGDTALMGLARLDRDVLSKKPTKVFVMFGPNDILWGDKADEEHFAVFASAMNGIVQQLKKAENAPQVFLVAYARFGRGQHEALLETRKVRKANDFLQKMNIEEQKIAEAHGARFVNPRLYFNKAAEKGGVMHAGDGVHFTELGQNAIAYGLLKELGAPSTVSSVDLEFKGGVVELLQAKSAAVSELSGGADPVRISFKRQDDGIPVYLGAAQSAAYLKFIPFESDLNRYELRARGLPSGDYQIKVNHKVIVEKISANALGVGVNLSSSSTDFWWPTSIWNGKSMIIGELANFKAKIGFTAGATSKYMGSSSSAPQLLEALENSIKSFDALEKIAATPEPFFFEITKL
jgi:lysophospholipase L1-like esterase